MEDVKKKYTYKVELCSYKKPTEDQLFKVAEYIAETLDGYRSCSIKLEGERIIVR